MITQTPNLFASGMKVTTVVKENRRAEQRGPTGIHHPRKMEKSLLPTRKEDIICPFKINIRFNKKDDHLFYL
jgi:hypothetical protein